MMQQEARWAVLRTQPRRESLAALAVRANGVESYVPQLQSRRRRERTVPLFPGYIFARIVPGSDDLLRIRAAPGVSYCLPRASAPTLLPEYLVDELRVREAAAASEAARRLLPGERLTIAAGPLRWSDALFDRYLNASGRVRVLTEMVCRTVTVDLTGEHVERR